MRASMNPNTVFASDKVVLIGSVRSPWLRSNIFKLFSKFVGFTLPFTEILFSSLMWTHDTDNIQGLHLQGIMFQFNLGVFWKKNLWRPLTQSFHLNAKKSENFCHLKPSRDLQSIFRPNECDSLSSQRFFQEPCRQFFQLFNLSSFAQLSQRDNFDGLR